MGGGREAVITEARKEDAPVYLVGTSWGAKTALAIIAEDPAAVNGTILLVPALKTTKETLFEKLRTALGYWFAPDRPIPLPLTPPDYIPRRHLCERVPASDTKLLSEMDDDTKLLHAATPRFHVEANRMQQRALRALTKQAHPSPILMLFAGKDKIVKEEASRALVQKASGEATEVLLPEQGHGVQIQNPDLIAIQMEQWIQYQRRPHP